AFRPGLSQRLARGDQATEQVDLVIVVDALENRGDALQAHPGVDALLRQLGYDLARRLLILHEDEVPDLDEAVAVLVRASWRPACEVLAMVVEYLGTGPAWAIVAHRPEIVLGRDLDDPAVGKTADLLPQAERLVIGVIDGSGQPAGAQPPLLGDQVPGELDRAVLEIIAKREIAEHFEEGVVAGGVTDIVEIVVLAARADAFLGARGGLVRPRLEPGEHVLERHHAGVDEHQRRVVVRHQWRRPDPRMAILLEKIEEGTADVVRRNHGSDVNALLHCGKDGLPRWVLAAAAIPLVSFNGAPQFHYSKV